MKKILLFVPLIAGMIFAAGCISTELGFPKVVSAAKEKVFPAVVYIHVVQDNLQSGRDEGSIVSGSGVIISGDGEVLTNWHVVDKAQQIRCLLNDGQTFSARVVGIDKDLDLALLKLDLPEGTKPLPMAALAEGDCVTEGDFVMAMGAPWGFSRSVSMGIISCANRYLAGSGEYTLWYQTDASISPGNSGGPLVNTEGKVVGINTLGVLFGGTVGFSIPSQTIRDVLPRMREYGRVNWSWFGFQLQPLFDFERNIRFNFDDGVIISGTEPGSPARKAGFLPNDRIISVNGETVVVATGENIPEFKRLLGLMPFDVPVKFEVMRGDEKLTINVAPIAKGKVEGDEIACSRWGLTAKAINRFDTPNLYYYREEGVYIFGVAMPGNAWRTNLRQNDIIVSIDDREVMTLEDLNDIYQKAVENVNENSKALFTVLRNGKRVQVVLDFYTDYNNEEE